jgi:nucleoid-associated protein YgaU
MTADAKVGLLLGLFFIALIAFLINGLPSMLQSASPEDSVKTTAIIPPAGPALVINQGVSDTAHRLSPGIPLRAVEPPQEVIVLDNSAPRPTAAVAIEATAPQPETAKPSVIEEQVNRLPQPVVPQPAPTRPVAAGSREHTVQKGENLSSIAQKYYGAEEGNRRAVIQKLYEANTDVLSSPDRVVVGSKLTVPPLTETAPAKPSQSETLLQKFSNVFERAATPPPTPRAAAPRTTEYVVQPGDSLWKIAEKTLGDGHKFDLLMQMNKDRLKSADDVVAGMKLVVPAP